MIHLTHLTREPSFADTFAVIRRAETVGDDGISVLTPTTFPNLLGSICTAGGNDLERSADAGYSKKRISVVTQFKLRGAAIAGSGQNYQPDLIQWHGDYFIVETLDDYSSYGAGFVQAECSSIDFQEAPTPGVPGGG